MPLTGTPLLPLAVACGLGAGAGAWLAFTALFPGPPAPAGKPGIAGRLARHRGGQPAPALARRAGAALAAAVIAGLVTRWPAGSILAALAVWAAPGLLAGTGEARAAVERIEAIASWTEMLRDTTSAAAGLEQAIAATAPLAPAPIRPQVTGLAAAIGAGQRLNDALRGFAAATGDPLADLVAAALIHAASHHARSLGELLGSLAAAARAQTAMRLRIEAGRASLRASVTMITAITAIMAAGLIFLDRGYLAPYATPAGQLVLLIAGAVFAAGFTALRRMARHSPPARILAPAPAPAGPAPAGRQAGPAPARHGREG